MEHGHSGNHFTYLLLLLGSRTWWPRHRSPSCIPPRCLYITIVTHSMWAILLTRSLVSVAQSGSHQFRTTNWDRWSVGNSAYLFSAQHGLFLVSLRQVIFFVPIGLSLWTDNHGEVCGIGLSTFSLVFSHDVSLGSRNRRAGILSCHWLVVFETPPLSHCLRNRVSLLNLRHVFRKYVFFDIDRHLFGVFASRYGASSCWSDGRSAGIDNPLPWTFPFNLFYGHRCRGLCPAIILKR